jgi:2-polyprenyl-6-methoxyphenol hydroxylase-like FAD-dependent oxidoreductase
LKKLDVAIAGAGPGGLAAALALHRLGHKVTVFEQFEKPRPVGSGLILQPTGLAVMEWLELGQHIRSLGARIDRLTGTATDTGKTVLDVRYSVLGAERGCAVHRAALFNVLLSAVQTAGIPVETTRQISNYDSGVLVFDNGAKTSRFDVVVDALGARSPLRRHACDATSETALAFGAVWASLPWPGQPFDSHALVQRYHKASVMVGVLPIGRVAEGEMQQAAFFWSLKQSEVGSWRAAGVDAWKNNVSRYWPEVQPLLQHIQHTDDLTVAKYQHHTIARPYGDRLICIGDSAHSTSPQLGQGANMALLDVRALADALVSQTCFEHVAKDYAHRRKRHVRLYQLLSYAFTPFYQSDSHFLPLLRDHLVPLTVKLGFVERLLAKIVAGQLVEPVRAGLHFNRGAGRSD